MRSRITMRIAFALVSLLLAVPSARASSVSRLGSMTRGQMSFDGLDLSDDDKKTTKKKKKEKPGKKTKKGTPKAEETPDTAAPDLSVTPSPKTGNPPPDASPAPDLGSPAVVKKSAPPQAPAPTMSFEEVDVSGKSAERQKLDVALTQFKKGQYDDAAVSLSDIIKDPANLAIAPEAQYLLAKTLYRMGLYHSSLANFHNVLAAGPQNKFFKSSLEWLFFIAHKTVNEEIVLEEVAKYSNYEFPPKFQGEFHYLLARFHFNRGKALIEVGRQPEGQKELDESTKLIRGFGAKDPFYGKGEYLAGLIDFDQNKSQPALDAFKEVVKANNPRSGGNWDEHLRELAFMQLARIHYGAKQNRYAIAYFDKVPPGSDQWLESLFEASWAHFRIGQYEKALGNMITLQAPFFRDEYFPESLILKAVTYYENCRYKEARDILNEFDLFYHPVRDALDKIVKDGESQDAQHYFDVLEGIEKKTGEAADANNRDVLGRVLKLALTDKDLKSTNDSILEVEHETDALNAKKDTFKFSDLAKDLGEGLKTEREKLIKTAGFQAQAKLQHELKYLSDLLNQGLRIQFEISTQEKEVLEAAASGTKVDPKVLKALKVRDAVGDDEELWPYEGEYWRDELGTYEYTLTKTCKNIPGAMLTDPGDTSGGGSP
jgi:TolA-binding protein